MTKPLVDNGEFRRVGETPTPWPCFVIAARQEVIEQQRPALRKLLQVINRATKDFMNNKETSLQLISERFQLLPEDAATWFSSTRWSTGSPVETNMLQKVLDTLYDLQIIDHTPDPANLLADVGMA